MTQLELFSSSMFEPRIHDPHECYKRCCRLQALLKAKGRPYAHAWCIGAPCVRYRTRFQIHTSKFWAK